MRRAMFFTLCLGLLPLPPAHADGPADNVANAVRPIPPRGIAMPEPVRIELQQAADEFLQAIRKADVRTGGLPDNLLPDVLVLHKAVDWALRFNEFYDPKEFGAARELLGLGHSRLQQLINRKPAWLTDRGLVVRAYRSAIDQSIQPFGLIVPESYRPGDGKKYRLDVWCHGRGEKLTELAFLNDRRKNIGTYKPGPETFVLHPYGRYCNANKFAGEVDLFEALKRVKQDYPIDDDRIVMRGFSMGGAAAWQFAVHFAGEWVAAAPGAGFSETADFLKVFQKEVVQPTWYEQKLWRWYDCTNYAGNLLQCPTIAYSGEKDPQMQAALVMEKAMAGEGLKLLHLIGPGMGHQYHPQVSQELNRRIDAIAAIGREPMPRRLRFTTYTLRYPTMRWLTVEGLQRHWERADVEAELIGSDMLQVRASNVSQLSFAMPPGQCPFTADRPVKVRTDQQTLDGGRVLSDRSWSLTIHREKDSDPWKIGPLPDVPNSLRKRVGLTGPIDDAFMDRFLVVSPTGKPFHPATGRWVDSELGRLGSQWRSQYRGDLPLKKDSDVSEADIAQANLILWGDPSSNRVLARLIDRLPIRWVPDRLTIGSVSFPAAATMPVMIYPNPLNPGKYVVLNSGFTWREYDALNNARQVPKLPDWAAIDLSTPPDSRWPGRVVAAGFFDERWNVQAARPNP